MPRFQLKLFAALASLVAGTVLLVGLFAERGLRQRELRHIEQSLLEQAALVQELLAQQSLATGPTAAIDALADRAGRASGARVTLIAPGGAVIGDSDVSLADLAGVENHRDRPEVAQALAGRVGQSTRRSDTVGRRLLYLAIPASSSPGGGVVRLALDLDDVEGAVAALRRELIVAGGLGVVGALLLSLILSWLSLRSLRELREVVSDLARGRLDRRLRWRSRDELGEIGAAIDGMAEQLEGRVRQLASEKEQLRAVLSGMVEGVLVLDAAGRILLANPRLRELLGVWGDVEGRLPIEVVRHAEVEDILRGAAAGAGPVLREIELPATEDRTLLVHAVSFPSDGPRLGTVAVFHDVTELRRLEQVRRDFVANASHELRTPLTAIRGFADTLLAGEASEQERISQLEIISRHSERLGRLIDDLLELSRIESRQSPLECEEVQVDRLARNLLDDMGAAFRDRGLQVRFEGADPPAAWADRRAVEQVLFNLFDNAIKYSEPGGEIAVQVSATPGSVRVAVADTGIGIPDADRARIFERFYRVDEARSRALGGTGLGLSIVKHLLQAMGGEVYVESELGKGTTFRFTLPRADLRFGAD